MTHRGDSVPQFVCYKVLQKIQFPSYPLLPTCFHLHIYSAKSFEVFPLSTWNSATFWNPEVPIWCKPHRAKLC